MNPQHLFIHHRADRNHKCDLFPEATHSRTLVAIDKLDKIGKDGALLDIVGYGVGRTEAVELLDALVGHSEPLEYLGGLLAADPIGAVAVRELSEILRLTKAIRGADRIEIDPSLARGLSYYTGAIMEVAVDGIGSLGGGGRYDNLVGMFLGRDVPACGFSLGLERIIVVMTERNMFPASVGLGAVDVMVTIWNEEARGDALTLASELRRAGLRVDVYPEPDKLGKQIKYASSRNVPFVAILGDDERARGEVAIKDLRSGEQKAMARSEAVAYIAGGLNPKAVGPDSNP
jgi:histidyl-tRNA synthetase